MSSAVRLIGHSRRRGQLAEGHNNNTFNVKQGAQWTSPIFLDSVVPDQTRRGADGKLA